MHLGHGKPPPGIGQHRGRRASVPRCPQLAVVAVVAVWMAPAVGGSSAFSDDSPDCTLWAKKGECTSNPDYMNVHCKKACADNPLDAVGEPEQCVGWALQGECTRNPKYMMQECPKSCKQQRAKMHEGLLDERPDCLEIATGASACAQPKIAESCPGTCATHAMCHDEHDPPECERALRCRELKDDWPDCAKRVKEAGCEDVAHASTLLKHCYLSCAREGQEGLLRRFRLKYSVRTRRHGFLDEDSRHWPAAGAMPHPLPCWKGSIYDPQPASTCANGRATLVHRWRRVREPRCAALRETTPRAPPRRTLRLPRHLRPSRSTSSADAPPEADADADGGGENAATQLPPVSVLPLLTSPKVRLVESFLSDEEAQYVIRIGLPTMHRSLAGGRTESIRTSSTGMLPAGDPVVRRITERAAYVTGYPYENIEPLQLVRYTEGQKYEPHFDYGEACDFEENLVNGHRHVTVGAAGAACARASTRARTRDTAPPPTPSPRPQNGTTTPACARSHGCRPLPPAPAPSQMLVYLNSVPEEAEGWTAFPKLKLRVNPSAHAAVVFNDCLPNGEEDPRTLHGGSPPLNGTKIAINVWIRVGGARARAREREGERAPGRLERSPLLGGVQPAARWSDDASHLASHLATQPPHLPLHLPSTFHELDAISLIANSVCACVHLCTPTQAQSRTRSHGALGSLMGF